MVGSGVTPVLLHGAGTGGWVWDRVRAAMATPALAPDLPSLTRDLSPPDCAAAIVEGLDGAGDVALVLHSLAGVLGADLARLLGPRLRHVTYVAAVIPADRQSFARARGWRTALLLRALFLVNRGVLTPPARMIRNAYGNDLTEADIAMLVARTLPDRRRMDLEPTGAPVAEAPSTYLRLTLDLAVTPAEQDRMIARLKAPKVVEVAAGHMAPLSRPQAIAAAIEADLAQIAVVSQFEIEGG